VTAFRNFMEEMRDEVLKLVREGKSLEEIKKAVRMPKYQSWAGYQQMIALNVEGMVRMIQANRRGN